MVKSKTPQFIDHYAALFLPTDFISSPKPAALIRLIKSTDYLKQMSD